MCDGAHGTPLIPWPNRLADGSCTFDGHDYQVAITGPDKHNAIHGFLRWRNWTVAEHAPAHVVMTITLNPMKGYPFALEVQVRYEVSEDGLTVTTSAANIGDRTAPYACGQHPYLSAGRATLDECTLTFDAATRIATDKTRELPTGRVAVPGTEYDFATSRRIGDTAIDDAFTDLVRDDQGRAWVSLTRPDGRTATLWVDRSYPIVELFTADTLRIPRRRRGLGVEPMSAPPNAFRSGDNVVRLEPGESVAHTWGATLHQSSTID